MGTPAGRWSYRMTQDRRTSDLPVLPTTVQRLLGLDQERTEFFEELSTIVEAEPALAVRLVALANSAAYQRGKVVTRVREAAVRVGAESALDLVLAASVARVFVPRRPWESSLWVHAVRVASFSRALATPCDPREVCADTAYFAGLLHELGRFVLFQEAPWALRDVAEARHVAPDDVRRAEKVALGIDHVALGAEVAARWGLPTAVVTCLSRYPTAPADPDAPRLAGLVHAADALDPTAGDLADRFDAATLLARLRAALPAWYPFTAERVLASVRTAADDARARAEVLLPHLFPKEEPA